MGGGRGGVRIGRSAVSALLLVASLTSVLATQNGDVAEHVHLLSCETRPAVHNGTTARDLRLRTLKALSPSFIITELCTNRVWPKRDFGLMKVRAVADYAHHAPPKDVLIFVDSDVLFNSGMTTPGEVVRRFHAARGSSRILFMAEPWCFAPTMKAVTRRSGSARSVNVDHGCTEATLLRYEHADRSHAQRSWRCPRFLNSGLYAGVASEVAKLGELWAKPTLWLSGCQKRPNWGYADQCIAMEIMLLGNVSIALDTHEALFASGGTAVEPPPRGPRHLHGKNLSSTRCSACGRTACHCSLRNEWSIPDSWRASTFDNQMGLRSLRRRAGYRNLCANTEVAPFIIHFNGVSKRLMKTAEMLAWIKAFFPP